MCFEWTTRLSLHQLKQKVVAIASTHAEEVEQSLIFLKRIARVKLKVGLIVRFKQLISWNKAALQFKRVAEWIGRIQCTSVYWSDSNPYEIMPCVTVSLFVSIHLYIEWSSSQFVLFPKCDSMCEAKSSVCSFISLNFYKVGPKIITQFPVGIDAIIEFGFAYFLNA